MQTQTIQFMHADGNDVHTSQVTLPAAHVAKLKIAVPAAATTPTPIPISITVAALSLLFLVSDVALTLKTNNAQTPDDTLTLAAGQPLVWYRGGAQACPLEHDVSEIFATNAGGKDGVLTVRVVQGAVPTPKS